MRAITPSCVPPCQTLIDMGIRIEREPNPNIIVRLITRLHHALMTSPELIDRPGVRRKTSETCASAILSAVCLTLKPARCLNLCSTGSIPLHPAIWCFYLRPPFCI
ncbi:hypothetical protein BN1184_CF_00020 [Pantoea ananatis]|nr:hypothetical protein BN1184_CF_00020 [Pantoea ananatis]